MCLYPLHTGTQLMDHIPWIGDWATVGCGRREIRVPVESFVQDGVLVVDDILTPEELSAAQAGLHETLWKQHSIDPNCLAETGHHLSALSSTNGSGGVLDLFYDEWKMLVATNANLFDATCQLWEAAYCHSGERFVDLDEADRFKWHPYGAFDCTKGYMYIDRIGYRIPTELAQELGAKVAKSTSRKKTPPLQRSLTPHLDCCPDTLYTSNDVKKWRPIQCFVALSDALEPNHGGLEAVRGGFHRDFASWARTRAPTISKHAMPAAPCLGEYTHIRPVEDADVMARIQHVPVRAGSAVVWDNRVPHANSYRHNGTTPRAVVYCSFLPDVPLNRHYCQTQLDHWKAGRNPTDQWIRPSQVSTRSENEVESTEPNKEIQRYEQQCKNIETILVTPLARRLAGLDQWQD